jgi:hypothetical protein
MQTTLMTLARQMIQEADHWQTCVATVVLAANAAAGTSAERRLSVATATAHWQQLPDAMDAHLGPLYASAQRRPPKMRPQQL